MLYTALYRPMHHRLFLCVIVDGKETTMSWCVYSAAQPTHKNFDRFCVGEIVRVAIWRYPSTIAISHTRALCVCGCLDNLP